MRLNAEGSVDSSCILQIGRDPRENGWAPAFSSALPVADVCFVVGSHWVPSETWPRALSRLVTYLPPPLEPQGFLPNLGFTMAFDTLAGVSYRLENSTDLMTWTYSTLSGTGTRIVISDAESLIAPRKFYRVGFDP